MQKTTTLILWQIIVGLIVIWAIGLFINWTNINNPKNISVEWEWKVFMQPDTITLNINVENKESTTKLAQQKMLEKIEKIHETLSGYNIPKENIQTTNYSIHPQYKRTDDESKIIGYRANQSLSIKIKDINGINKWKTENIINSVTEIGEITINNISYNIEDKSTAYSKARKLASQKALQKAQELAKLNNVKLGKAQYISEYTNYTDNNIPYYSNVKELSYDAGMWWWSDEIAIGQMELTLNVNISYKIK